jgi:hypothetical protein
VAEVLIVALLYVAGGMGVEKLQYGVQKWPKKANSQSKIFL